MKTILHALHSFGTRLSPVVGLHTAGLLHDPAGLLHAAAGLLHDPAGAFATDVDFRPMLSGMSAVYRVV